MTTVLALMHTQEDGSLPKAAREALTAASQLAAQSGAALSVGVIGKGASAAADTVAGCGAASFWVIGDEAVYPARYATDAAAVTALVKAAGAQIVVAPGSSRFMRCLPGASYRLGAVIDTHIVAQQAAPDGSVRVQRWFYRQRILGSFSRAARPWLLVVDSGVNAPWEGAAGSASAQTVEVAFAEDGQRTTVTGARAPAADAQTIRPDAPLLFVAGAGWTKKQKDGQPHIAEASGLIQTFLGKTQASLGSSKSLVDIQSEGQETLHFMSHMNQIGQTGSTPRHPKGLATCCHGEEPHAVGWRFINERRAVNLDPNCGWAQGKADVVYVADAFDVMARVNELL
ncbi:MAG TPA: electron transfer flavoprotein subunit alpha [Kiritimatiellia bacterium]|nr:electron transfer flavoprotein subunit alpha [Kiritimatiellia bacterium]HOR98719.1 electron transfer flavoprotein subunit alpha [Kiritimatiellia bacterium]HPC49406.1 electron transfer flavoprotein subunit alpha [Kiritimatiellia bacterium]HPW76246.1 electron transfer flavoprotein subunit alpha [Kiritimatiellia bacterium]